MKAEEIVTAEVADPTRFGSPTALGMRAATRCSCRACWPGTPSGGSSGRQALRNVEATLRAAGGTLRSVVKITFYLTDIRDKTIVWEVRKAMFGDHRPASTLVEVAHLVDPEARLEVEAVAFLA